MRTAATVAERDRPWAGRSLHFVGVGGAGMSGLALIAARLGARVSGSDRASSPYLERLRAAKITVTIGHDAANVPAGAELVYSSAIPPTNVERAAARAAGLRELHRSTLLAQVAALRRCLAVTGTHGKTTTTAMIVEIMRACGMDPAYVVGGELVATDANAGWGEGEWIVVEADESDRSLLALSPEIAVLTSAELDHHTTYASLEDLRATLRQFMARAGPGGAVVWDRPQLRELCPGGGVPYDACAAAPSGEGMSLRWRGLQVNLPVPGRHNAINAAGALTAAVLAGADPQRAVRALESFRGARRRLEHLGRTASGAAVYDDYAHHPTEVRETIAAARVRATGRLIAVFQPHLFSRTRALAREFGAALATADACAVLEIYPARERAEDFPHVSGLAIARHAADQGAGRTVAWTPTFAQARLWLARTLRAGDLCLLMGAGDIDSLARSLLDRPPLDDRGGR
jgi:UDP-N-acetylmuramate--alanine ligase